MHSLSDEEMQVLKKLLHRNLRGIGGGLRSSFLFGFCLATNRVKILSVDLFSAIVLPKALVK